MPFDAQKLDELKANVAMARKRPLAFGLCLGKVPETTLLLNHKTKDPETVGRMAKKEGETTKIAFGMMTVEAKNLNLMCHGDVIPGLARKTKEMLKAAGLKMKVRILDAAGNVLEENGDDEDDGEDAPAVGPDGQPDPQKEKWLQTRGRIEDALARTGAEVLADLAEARATWQGALRLAEATDFDGALQAATATARLIAAAVEAARAAEADRARWLAAEAKLRPIIEGLGSAPTPEVKKLTAYWSFALNKVSGPVPDFSSAMKTVTTLVKLIGDIRAKGGAGSSSSAPGQGAPTPKGGANGAPPVTEDENTRLMTLSDAALEKADLTLGDTKALFSDDYMQRLKDAPIKGEGDPKLKDLMREIEKGLSGPRRMEVMQALSRIVGIPPSAEQLDTDYGRFLVVQKQQALKAKKKKDSVPGLDEGMHPDFRGSRSQLMFGKVLGDAFGIHEVFAALLSPTGGLVGPGNWLIEPGNAVFKDGVKAGHLAPDNPVALHGTVHDAAGYLGTFHDDGPGYNYRDEPIEDLIGMALGGPLSGQLTGIDYWIDKAGPAYVEKRVDAAVVEVEKQLKTARDAVAAEIDLQIAAAKRKAAEAVALATKAAEEAERKAAEVADALEDAAAEVEKQVKKAHDAAAAEVDLRVAEAKRKAAEAVEEAKKLARKAEKVAVKVADAIVETPARVQKTAVETFDKATKKIGKIKADAKRKLEAAWDFIWS